MALGMAIAVATSLSLSLAAGPASPRLLEADRRWDVLPAPKGEEAGRDTLRAAARALGARSIEIADVAIDGALLERLAATPEAEPLTRAVREALRRPVDVTDLCLFLDDVLREKALDAGPVALPSERARRIGVLVHPDEVYPSLERPAHRYGDHTPPVIIDPPAGKAVLRPAPDGAPLGPAWAGRFPPPATEEARLEALASQRPGSDLAARLRSLVRQLRDQGAEVSVESTVRSRARGFLMWGAFWLSRSLDARQLSQRVRTLEVLNRRWGLHVPVRWRSPGPWPRTRDAAREMAEAYEVAYATRHGARSSDHYDGRAIDLVATGLPRSLALLAPDGARATFDLSGDEEPRDLSLTPRVVAWVEEHFGLVKLERDYPHWGDARPDAVLRSHQGPTGPAGSPAP